MEMQMQMQMSRNDEEARTHKAGSAENGERLGFDFLSANNFKQKAIPGRNGNMAKSLEIPADPHS